MQQFVTRLMQQPAIRGGSSSLKHRRHNTNNSPHLLTSLNSYLAGTPGPKYPHQPHQSQVSYFFQPSLTKPRIAGLSIGYFHEPGNPRRFMPVHTRKQFKTGKARHSSNSSGQTFAPQFPPFHFSPPKRPLQFHRIFPMLFPPPCLLRDLAMLRLL